MLKKLTGRNQRSLRGLKDRIANIDPCQLECMLRCDVRPGEDKFSLDVANALI